MKEERDDMKILQDIFEIDPDSYKIYKLLKKMSEGQKQMEEKLRAIDSEVKRIK